MIACARVAVGVYGLIAMSSRAVNVKDGSSFRRLYEEKVLRVFVKS